MARLIQLDYNPLRRSRQSSRDAQRTQFLGREIDLSQKSAEVQRDGLALQQQQIDFNKQMQGINIALNMTNAAVGLANAIGSYRTQQENAKIDEAKLLYQKGVNTAILEGKYNPYADTPEGLRYIGFDNYELEDGTTLGDLKKQIGDIIGGGYLTPGGAEKAKQRAVNALEHINVNAQSQIAGKVIKDREALFEQRLANATEVWRQTGDRSQFDSTLSEASWKSGNELEALILKGERYVKEGTVLDEAIGIAGQRGIGATEEFLSSKVANKEISEEQKINLLANAQNASNRIKDAAVTNARETFNKQLENGIGNAARAALNTGSDNPDVNEAVKREIDKLQTDQLEDNFFKSFPTRSVSTMTDSELQNVRRNLINRRGDYDGQEASFIRHLEYLDREIDRRQNAGGGRSSSSSIRGKELALMYEAQFERGDIETFHEAAMKINATDATEQEKRDILGRVYGGGIMFRASSEFKAADAELSAWVREDPSYAPEADRIREYFFMARGTGKVTTEEQAIALIQETMKDVRALRLNKAIEGSGDFLDYVHYDQFGNRSLRAHPDAQRIMAQREANQRQTIEKATIASGWEFEGNPDFKEWEEGDTTGLITHTLKRGDERVEVMTIGKDVMMKKGNGWVPFDQEITRGRTASINEFETNFRSRYPEIWDKIDQIMNNRPNANTVKFDIKEAMGNIGTTDIAKAWIDKIADEGAQGWIRARRADVLNRGGQTNITEERAYLDRLEREREREREQQRMEAEVRRRYGN